MPMNRIQFQPGLSLPAFLEQSGTQTQCEAQLEQARWPNGFRCPRCDHHHAYRLRGGPHPIFQCQRCRTQTSLTAGTLLQGTHLPLTTWFLAPYLICQAKTGLSALALKRQLGVSYPTAWLIHHKLMPAMVEREAGRLLTGHVQVDDAYRGGELSGGTAGRGSENKVPFLAAVSLTDSGRPLYTTMTPLPGFTLKAVTDWAGGHLAPGCTVSRDGLACFAGVTAAGCTHQPLIISGRQPKDVPEFAWINTLLGNLKTSLSGAYHAFDFAKYGTRYLAAFAYRFNRRFNLETLPARLLIAAATTRPRPDRWIRAAVASC